MNKIRVSLVKYDMDKTKNRKRKNLLVKEQTEDSVIQQLERIHKGEKVVQIHEVVWDEEQIQEATLKAERKKAQVFSGEIIFFDPFKGFGYVKPDKNMDDLFFHETALSVTDIEDGALVTFEVGQGPKGACAIKVTPIDD